MERVFAGLDPGEEHERQISFMFFLHLATTVPTPGSVKISPPLST